MVEKEAASVVDIGSDISSRERRQQVWWGGGCQQGRWVEEAEGIVGTGSSREHWGREGNKKG